MVERSIVVLGLSLFAYLGDVWLALRAMLGPVWASVLVGYIALLVLFLVSLMLGPIYDAMRRRRRVRLLEERRAERERFDRIMRANYHGSDHAA